PFAIKKMKRIKASERWAFLFAVTRPGISEWVAVVAKRRGIAGTAKDAVGGGEVEAPIAVEVRLERREVGRSCFVRQLFARIFLTASASFAMCGFRSQRLWREEYNGLRLSHLHAVCLFGDPRHRPLSAIL